MRDWGLKKYEEAKQPKISESWAWKWEMNILDWDRGQTTMIEEVWSKCN